MDQKNTSGKKNEQKDFPHNDWKARRKKKQTYRNRMIMYTSQNERTLTSQRQAKDLYFPGGVSTEGNCNNFDVELLHSKSRKCYYDLTVEQMYDLS
ncbi:hypothetical protein JTB14_004144 [Gonioctena quinquepunctata]|nr:hypothetical protein JTB14_004144 [Gonioctena quinquepunctata]